MNNIYKIITNKFKIIISTSVMIITIACSKNVKMHSKKKHTIKLENNTVKFYMNNKGKPELKLKHRYICESCKASFSKKKDLTIHIRNHNGDKPYSCSNCKKKFISSAMLKKHLIYQSSKKSFSCDYCPKQYFDKNILKKHIKIEHSKEIMLKNECPLISALNEFKIEKEKKDNDDVIFIKKKKKVFTIE